VSANQHQQEQQQPQFWNADHLQQQQEQLLLLQTSDRGWTSHPSSLHSSLGRTGGSGDDFPASGQPLTPNQKIQLQRYLLRQQHLLQTSGMRVRSGSVAPPMPTGGNGAQGASGSEGGCLGDAAENSRTARRPHELQRSRTYIVQGEQCMLMCGLPAGGAHVLHVASGLCCWQQHACLGYTVLVDILMSSGWGAQLHIQNVQVPYVSPCVWQMLRYHLQATEQK
jgi:hypothetical protein